MKINKMGFVNINSMNYDQTIAFILFLIKEKERHLDDIKKCEERMDKAAKRFNLTITPEGEVGE